MSFKCDLLAFSGPRLIFVRGQESSSGPGTRFLSVPILLSGEAECCRLDAVRVIEIEDESVKKSVACEVR